MKPTSIILRVSGTLGLSDNSVRTFFGIIDSEADSIVFSVGANEAFRANYPTKKSEIELLRPYLVEAFPTIGRIVPGNDPIDEGLVVDSLSMVITGRVAYDDNSHKDFSYEVRDDGNVYAYDFEEGDEACKDAFGFDGLSNTASEFIFSTLYSTKEDPIKVVVTTPTKNGEPNSPSDSSDSSESTSSESDISDESSGSSNSSDESSDTSDTSDTSESSDSTILLSSESSDPIVLPTNYKHLVGAGGEFAIAVQQDGSIVFWGNQRFGNELIPSGTNFKAVAACTSGCAALRTDGTVASWGGGYWDGQPQSFTDPGLTNVVQITGNSNTFWALHDNGSISTWGKTASSDPSGAVARFMPSHQSGLGIDASSIPSWWNHPVADWQTGFPTVAVDQIDVNDGTGVALYSDNTIGCWGNDTYGIVSGCPSITNAQAVAIMVETAYAIQSNGSITHWGADNNGPNYNFDNYPTTGNFLDVITSWANAYFIKDDGTLYGVGSDMDGANNPPAMTLYGF